MNFRCFILFFTLCFSFSFSQQQESDKDLNSISFEHSNDKLKQQSNLKSLDSALVIWNQKEKIKKQNASQEFFVAWKIASCYRDLGLSIKALEFYKSAEVLLPNLHAIDATIRANFYYDLCDFYYTISNHKLFKNNLIKAISLWETNSNQFSNKLLESYDRLMANYLEYGDINNAKLYLSKVKTLLGENNTPKFQFTVYLYELRIAIAEKDIIRAEKQYNVVKNYFSLLQDKSNFLMYYADATNFYAEAIFTSGKTKEALLLLNESIVWHKKTGNNLSLITVYSYYSYFARELNDYSKAQQAVDEAIYIIEPNNFSDLAGLYINKGIIYFLEENYKKAEVYFDKAHQLIKRIENTDFYLLSYNIEISKKYLELFEKTKHEKLLQKSFDSYKYSVKQFQDFYDNDLFNPLLTDFKNNITEGLLLLGLKSEDQLVEIVALIENIQSRFLIKNYLLNNKFNANELVNELSEIKTLQLKLASISVINNQKEATNLKKTQIKNQIEGIEKKIVEKYPNFNSIFNPKFNFKNFIQNNNAEILRYYVTNESLFGVFLTKEHTLYLKRLGDIAIIKEKVSNLAESIKNKASITSQCQEIYNLLLKPFTFTTSEITIISNSFLNELPFELLLDEKGQYVVENFAINYATSLPLYQIQTEHTNNSNFKLAIFQPSYTNKNVATLPFAAKEALYLQEHFNSSLFSNEKASKENFISEASKYNVYHLSMHAVIDPNDEDTSRLLFNDEDFYFADFYGQKLPLDLVVLSACETGVGKLIEGEGLMSLSRAFTYSGVASTIHSLWEIPDKQAFEIMQLFYDNISKGLSKSEALQQAKKEYLKTCKAEELQHPYYWSGFVLHGNSKALVHKQNIWFQIIIGSLLFLLVIILFLKFRK
ncbi:CHAT domain-containing protein [Flavobacterium sp. TP390]|uniref:CHAT domain-containing protein n=1 Tax=Flavobacterium profundi TaxID=1774945 RepID=A0A6I4ISF0_9FLAO|nr:CHAT domain-containing protein [Flavobacterium profundi]MVO09476.1 CHAT domain-containing protein [Flavobacterium profundi]